MGKNRVVIRAVLVAVVTGIGVGGTSALREVRAEEAATLENPVLAFEVGGAAPRGWSVVEGARAGEGPSSRIAAGAEGGARLEGDGATRVWQMLSQRANVPSDATCRLTFEARIVGARLDPGQNDNAYVGVRLLGGRESTRGPTSFVIERVTRPTWTLCECVFRVDGKEAHVTAFLSKTGALEVRKVTLEVLRPEQAFDVLVQNVARQYSFLELKGPGLAGKDWATHAAAFRERALAAQDEAALAAVLNELLAPLKDLHVSIKRTNGQIEYPYVPSYRANVELKSLKAALGELTSAGRAGYVARLEGGIGYLACTSLQGTDDSHARLRELFAPLLDAPGLIIDLRGNGGGDEVRAQVLLGALVDQPVVYARRKSRSGPAPGDFTEPWDAVLRPTPGARRYAGPIVVLLGPGCVSSGEGMAQMLDALPNVRTVGQPTQGASGNPQPVPLPGGLEVRFSRWVNVQLDGTLLEGRGVQPDLVVEHQGPGDPTLAAGLKEVQRLLAASKTPVR